MKTRIIKKEYTRWKEPQNMKVEGVWIKHGGECITDISYKLQYQKSFIGIKYWKDFTETLYGGYGEPFIYTSTVWMSDQCLLIDRFNCEMTKTKCTYE